MRTLGYARRVCQHFRERFHRETRWECRVRWPPPLMTAQSAALRRCWCCASSPTSVRGRFSWLCWRGCKIRIGLRRRSLGLMAKRIQAR